MRSLELSKRQIHWFMREDAWLCLLSGFQMTLPWQQTEMNQINNE